MAVNTKNEVAKNLHDAIATAPFLIEKQRYLAAIEEINRLQEIIDSFDLAKSVKSEQELDKNSQIIYPGSCWHADEDEHSVRFMRNSYQVFKAPKKSTEFAEYWPSPEMIKWMLTVLNTAEQEGNQPDVPC